MVDKMILIDDINHLIKHLYDYILLSAYKVNIYDTRDVPDMSCQPDTG